MPVTNIADLLAPETLARIDNYSFLARTAVEGFVSGLHRSLYHGYGSEFFQYRGYVPGDDLKHLDWKVYGRRDKFYTKLFQEETNLACCLVVDASASMGYRGTRAACSKLRYACMAAACLAYLARRQGDLVGLYAYREDLVCGLRPAQRTGQLEQLFVALARLEPAGTADLARAVSFVTEHLRRRSLVVLLSDFIGVEDRLPALLRQIRAAHHDCVVFQVLDPDEVDFPFREPAEFLDSESDRRVVTAPEQTRNAYLGRLHAFLDQVRLAALAQQTDYQLLPTQQSLGGVLAAYLHCREGTC